MTDGINDIFLLSRKSCQINSTYESTEPEAGETDKTENVYIEMKITKESPSIE